jgi:hypothetical protein
MVEPEGKKGRALPDLFLLPACTVAESLEQFRAVLRNLERFSLRCITSAGAF